MNRRAFIVAAASWGAAAAWGWPAPRSSQTAWHERRQLFPEGVASGDPDSNSVLFWTRYPSSGKQAQLTLEVAEDELFERVTASTPVTVSAEADWTCRVLVGGLKPARVYWYRFSDSDGNGSRIGRTVTAPDNDDSRSVRFAFVSCQNANQGAQNAYRRMIFEDLRASESERLDFVLHLGDFIYEIVWYPEDRPQGMYDRNCATSFATGMGRRFTIFTSRRRWMTIAPFTAPIFTIPICRMRVRAGPSSACGIITNIAGSAGRAFRCLMEKCGRRRPGKWLRIRPGSSISRRGSQNRAGRGWKNSNPRK